MLFDAMQILPVQFCGYYSNEITGEQLLDVRVIMVCRVLAILSST